MVGQIDQQVMTPDSGWPPARKTSPATYTIRRRGLQAEIQDVVKRYIIDHRFRPGDPLPGEGELARQLGISRPSLREAMKVLQTIGAVETRHGSGTYVGEFSLDALASGLEFQVQLAAQQAESTPDELLDLVDLREAMETHLIRRVAGRHTVQQINRMRTINRAIATASDRTGELNALDVELHMLFYAPLSSRVKAEFMQVFWTLTSSVDNVSTAGSGALAASDHTAIIDALVDVDRDAAAEAMARHMRHIVETVQRSWRPTGRAASVHPLYAD